jgi:hypothetical protein
VPFLLYSFDWLLEVVGAPRARLPEIGAFRVKCREPGCSRGTPAPFLSPRVTFSATTGTRRGRGGCEGRYPFCVVAQGPFASEPGYPHRFVRSLFAGRIRMRVVAVAQLVEHRIVAPKVAGSSPVGHPLNCR